MDFSFADRNKSSVGAGFRLFTNLFTAIDRHLSEEVHHLGTIPINEIDPTPARIIQLFRDGYQPVGSGIIIPDNR